MRDQFAGDISDLLKFSLLRALAGADKRLGVAWYFVNQSNGRNDGRHREYCQEDKWQKVDEHVWTALKEHKDLTVADLEKLNIWPSGVSFHRKSVSVGREREIWAKGMRDSLAGSDLIFVDPDNGIGRATRLHATIEEIESLCSEGRTVLFIHFPARQNHGEQISLLQRNLNATSKIHNAITLRTSVQIDGRPRARFFTICNYDPQTLERLTLYAERLKQVHGCKVQLVSTQDSVPAAFAANPNLNAGANQCPECGYQFRGANRAGIDAHWRSQHEDIVSYTEARISILNGTYQRQVRI